MADTNETAVFIFLDRTRRQVLMEKRGPSGSFANKIIFPGGAQDEDETLDQTVIREVKEELGVRITQKEKLETPEPIFGETGKRLHIFIIDEWKGTIPERVIDKGNSLLWVDLAKLEKTIEVKSSQRIAALVLKKYQGPNS